MIVICVCKVEGAEVSQSNVERSESARELRTALYKSDQPQEQHSRHGACGVACSCDVSFMFATAISRQLWY